MEKILTQQEIDALFQAAQKATPTAAAPKRPETRNVVPCNFRQAGLLNKEQVRGINLMHDTLARNLTNSFGAHLRVQAEVHLVSVEQITYAEYLQRVPELSYLASLTLSPLEALAAMQMDLSLAFPMIDLLLGGPGKTEAAEREVTEIEESILENVVRLFCREMEAAWQSVLEVRFEFDRRQQLTQLVQLTPPNERVFLLSFEVRLKEGRGLLVVVLPAVVSSALLRKLTQQRYYRRRRAPGAVNSRLRRRLSDAAFSLDLALPPLPILVQDLVDLQPGQVLKFSHRASEPATLRVGDHALALAFPTEQGSARAAQVLERLVPDGKGDGPQ